tara:strand:+ start:590 stop:1171 length:582 start_codon:yes stop_codon:yes gene_type:complete
MKEFNRPDVKAPRFRPKVYSVLNKEFFEKFKIKHPKYKNLDDSKLRTIIKSFNEMISDKVIDYRDGIELPQQLGWLFIGTCQTSKKDNIDFGKSREHGVQVTNKNWETDGKLAKIFYSNHAPKHKFRNREFWGFVACRKFKRNVSKTYPENWNKYLVVDPLKKLKLSYAKTRYKEVRLKKTQDDLKNYNEFNI